MNKKAALLALIRLRGIRSLPRIPRMQQPDAIRLRYFERLRRTVLADMWGLVERKLLPKLKARTDADDEDEVRAILEQIAEEFADRWSRDNFSKVVQPFAQDIQKFSAAQMNRVLEGLAGVDVVGAEPWLVPQIAAFVRDNVELIRSIPSQFFAEIEHEITTETTQGVRAGDLAETIRERFNVSESRANLIARDQTGKFYGKLNETRQTELGIEGYIWRTMRDNRVRDDHEERDGKHYEWNKPPPDGHPGQPIQCRCYPEPDLQPIIDEAWSARSGNLPGAFGGQVRPGWSEAKTYSVATNELDDVRAVEWEPARSKKIEQAFRENKQLPPIRVVTGPTGVRELDDGGHTLAVARRIGVRSVAVKFNDREAATIRKNPAKPKHTSEK